MARVKSLALVMTATLTAALSVSLAMIAASIAEGETPQEERLVRIVKMIVSEDASVRMQAFKELLGMGENGVKGLVKMIVEPGKGEDAGVRFALHGLAAYVTQSDREAERRIFVKVLTERLETDAPAAVKKFLIEQLQIAGRAECVAAIASFLTDEEMGESARQALLANPSEAALKALREALPKTKGLTRLGIIYALGQRRDRGSVQTLIAQASSPDETIRMAAIESLGRIGDERAEPVIASALCKGNAKEQQVAFDSYMRLGERLAADLKRARATKVYTLALRVATSNHHRRAALLAIGKVGSAKVLQMVLPYLTDEDTSVRYAASQCLAQLPDPKVSYAIIASMKTMGKSRPELKAALLRVLSVRKEPVARAAIESATKDANAEVRVTAFHLLGKLNDPALESTLLQAAEKGSDIIHPIALDAYIKLANERLQKNEKDAGLAMFTRALELARDNELRRMALRGLTTVASVKSLPKIEPLLTDEALRADALMTYVAIAGAIADSGDKQRAIDMLQEAIAMQPPRAAIERAVSKLNELGVKVDPARDSGFVTHWWIIGPFAGRAIDEEFSVEKEIDINAPVKVGGNEFRWVEHHTADIEGIVNLIRLMNPNQNTTAYLYAEVSVEKAQDVLFKTGSDDGMKCWLNANLIYRFPAHRSLRVDQDVFKARLEAGVNKVLLKVVNAGGGWGACLRITDLEGKPVKFEQ